MPHHLYYTPSSCGAASFIVAHAGGLINSGAVVAAEADIRSKKVLTGADAGKDYLAINPQGNVPCLVTESGLILAENAATMQFLGDLSPASGLVPAAGTEARYQLIAALSYIGTDIHAGTFGPLFNPGFAPVKDALVAKLKTKLDFFYSHWLQNGKKAFVLGDKPSAADIYAVICMSWSPYVGAPALSPELAAYSARVNALDFVVAARAAMAAASPKV